MRNVSVAIGGRSPSSGLSPMSLRCSNYSRPEQRDVATLFRRAAELRHGGGVWARTATTPNMFCCADPLASSYSFLFFHRYFCCRPQRSQPWRSDKETCPFGTSAQLSKIDGKKNISAIPHFPLLCQYGLLREL